MTQYINKASLVAEIEKRIKKYATINVGGSKELDALYGAKCHAPNSILSFLDTLEVKETKEVNLDESARHYLLHEHISQLNEVLHQADLKVEMQYHKDIEDAYKAGFELGLKAKDVNEIIKTAEDHAYFAGSENTREKLIDKACEWLDNNLHHYWGSISADPHNFLFDFRKAMEE